MPAEIRPSRDCPELLKIGRLGLAGIVCFQRVGVPSNSWIGRLAATAAGEEQWRVTLRPPPADSV